MIKMQNTAPKKFVFVLMQFNKDFDSIYQLGIKQACEKAGAYCERVDEQIFQESMLERIYNQISKADLIISDMTGKNPNVFYETGYSHALNKRVILLTQNVDDIPFDLKHYQHIVYNGDIMLLKRQLEEKISWYLSQHDGMAHDTSSLIEIYMNSQKVKNGDLVIICKSEIIKRLVAATAKDRSIGCFESEEYISYMLPKIYCKIINKLDCILSFQAHNASDKIIDSRLRLSLSFRKEYSDCFWLYQDVIKKNSDNRLIDLPDGSIMIEYEHRKRLWP